MRYKVTAVYERKSARTINIVQVANKCSIGPATDEKAG
jgi:hypothetical protein